MVTDKTEVDKVSLIEAYNNNFHNVLAQDMGNALVQCIEAEALSKTIGYKKGVVDAKFNRAWYHLWRCEFSDAFPLLRDSPDEYKALGDDFGYLKAINSLGVIHLDMGNYDSALPYFLRALDLSRDKKEKEREASVLANLGLLYDGLEKIEEAYDFFSEALKITELNDTGYYTATKCIALYHIKMSEYECAESHLKEAIRISRNKRDLHFESELLVIWGKLYFHQNKVVEAKKSFKQSFDISQQLGNKKIETENLYELGCLALEDERIELALSYFDEVLLVAENRDIGSFVCKSFEKLSVVYEQKKDYRQALEYLKKFNKAEKDFDHKQAELKLKSLSFEHQLDKKQREADIFKAKNIELKKANKKILQLANHDNLTGLPNRRLFMERFRTIIDIANRTQTKVAVLFIDLDNFKPVNDRFGHIAGDGLLKKVGERLVSCLSDNDVVARFGGDEFVILMPHLVSQEHIYSAGAKIIDLMQCQFTVEDQKHLLGSSIGISVYPDHGQDLESLLSKADRAMYSAKKNGKNTYALYDGDN